MPSVTSTEVTRFVWKKIKQMFYKKNEVCEHVWRLKSATNQINDDEFAEKWLGNSDVFDADNKL